MSTHLLEKRETKTEEQSSMLLSSPKCALQVSYLILKSRKKSHTSYSMIKEARLKMQNQAFIKLGNV